MGTHLRVLSMREYSYVLMCVFLCFGMCVFVCVSMFWYVCVHVFVIFDMMEWLLITYSLRKFNLGKKNIKYISLLQDGSFSRVVQTKRRS